MLEEKGGASARDDELLHFLGLRCEEATNAPTTKPSAPTNELIN